MFKYFKIQQLKVHNNFINYLFCNSYENETKNEVNSDQIESSSNEVEHDKNIDKSINIETSMLLSFIFIYHVNNSCLLICLTVIRKEWCWICWKN